LCRAPQLKLVTAGATINHVISPDPGQPALVLPTMLPFPPHHGLPIGQIFAPDVQLAAFKVALTAMLGLSMIPLWLDHPLVKAWFALLGGEPIGPAGPDAIHIRRRSSTSDALQDTALVFANKMRQACVESVHPKTTTTAWNTTHLSKAHPSTFEQALPKSHALPIKDNPFLVVM
jgi:hypothetical protein